MSRYGDDAEDSGESDNEPIQSSEQFKDRHYGNCTDIPCCVLFSLCLIALVAVAGYGFANGNPKKFHHGIQFDGEVCGVGINVTSKPYLYFCPPADWIGGALAAKGFNLNMDYPVCVAACPVGPPVVPGNASGNASGVADPDVDVVPMSIVECGYLNQATKAYKTNEEMNYCVPAGIHGAAKDAVAGGISSAGSTVLKFADSLSKGWPIYVVIFLLAMFLGYAYLCCLKVFARCMVWLAIIVAFLSLAIAGVWLIAQAPDVGTNQAMKENFGQFATTTAYILGGLCCAAALAILLLICCCFSQIEYAVVAVKMTGDVMSNIPTLLIAPVIKAIAKFFVGMLLLIGFVWLLSIAHPTKVLGSQFVRTFSYESFEWGLIFFYAFMFFWILSFMTALYQFAVAYVTADYYFAVSDFDGDRDVHCCGIMEGMCVGLMWHTGSLAFGSFIIACFEMVQKAMEYINRSNPNNPIAKCLSCICICCIAACKSCAQFVNKNAYIGIAIKGYNFCRGCQKAVQIMIKMAAGMAVLNGATFVFQVAGIVLITAICTVIAQMFSSVGSFTDPTSSWFIPHPPVVVLVSAMIGYAVAKVFMDVFDMVSDTLMYCFGLEGFDVRSGKCPPAVKEAFKDTDALNREKEQE